MHHRPHKQHMPAPSQCRPCDLRSTCTHSLEDPRNNEMLVHVGLSLSISVGSTRMQTAYLAVAVEMMLIPLGTQTLHTFPIGAWNT